MNLQIIKNFVEYLNDKGYSAQTIHAYSKALEQAPDTWNTNVPHELYEHITCSLQSKQELFLPGTRHNIKPASSLLFLMITGISFLHNLFYEKLPFRQIIYPPFPKAYPMG